MARSSPPAARPTVAFPGGLVIPSWSTVATPQAHKALRAVFEAFIGPKWGGMDAAESRVRAVVLRAYVATGRAPAPAEIAAALGLAPGEVAAALQRLAAHDLIVLDAAALVSGAYPFTDARTDHRVAVGSVTVGAMCAIDAMGISAMLQRDVTVHSACRHCRRSLTFRTRSRGREMEAPEPSRVVVWSGHRYADGCAASSLCTLQAFFCDDDHLAAWGASGPHAFQEGVRLTLAEALEVGRAIFEPMRKEMQPWLPTT